jgi:sister-chromatid-cohesion protein PDS5
MTASVLAEQVISEYILPLPNKGEDEAAWTDRLLTVMRFLDEKGVSTLISISGIKLS